MHAGSVPCLIGAFGPDAGFATPGPVAPPGPGRPARATLARLLTASALAVPFLAAAPGAAAPVRRNGNIYDFKAHQPTRAGVARHERRAGVTAPPTQVRRNARAVRQLDQHLLNEEAAPFPRDPVSLTPP